MFADTRTGKPMYLQQYGKSIEDAKDKIIKFLSGGGKNKIVSVKKLKTPAL